MPISAMMLRSFLKASNASSAPSPAEGIVHRIVIGWTRLSYSIPKTRYTVMRAARIRIRSLASESWNA